MEIKERLEYQKNYHKFLIDCKTTETINLFTSSDWHFDNPKCKRDLLFKDLNEAKSKNALIIITGDLFCLMQGKYDPRRSKSNIRPEHNGDNYLDLVIDDTVEKLRPYAKNIILITKGNHETKVSKNVETDVIQRLVEKLNTLEKTDIKIGQYTGYLTLTFESLGSNRKALNIGYSHGKWGGIVTKGTLSIVRYAAFMPDCDIMFSGHTHDGWIVPQPRLRRNFSTKKVTVENQYHIKTGTYKEEFEKGEGWAVENIAMPKYLGGCFTEIFYNSHKDLKFRCYLTN